MRTVIRVKHFSLSTERAYVGWIRRFILFHAQDAILVTWAKLRFGSSFPHLAVEQKISASTQTVALSAVLFPYRDVLKQDLAIHHEYRTREALTKLPVVFTRSEVQAVLARLDGTAHLIASPFMWFGLRLMEAVRLRIKDIDFERRELTTRQGKGQRIGVTMLPVSAEDPAVATAKGYDCCTRLTKIGFGRVELPFALGRKYPRAATEWGWQYAFPAARRSRDPRSGCERRHHLLTDYVQRAVKTAIGLAQLNRGGTSPLASS